MTERNVFSSGESENEFRQFLSYLFAQASNGVAADGVLVGLIVQQTSTVSSSVQVTYGVGVVQDTRSAGAFPVLNTATKVLDVLGPNPMGALPRNDIVVFDYATESIRALIGTPNASPTDPTIPATALPLARLRHAASATTIPSSKIDDLRVATNVFDRVSEARDYGSISVSGATSGNTIVNFPAGRFQGTPVVTLSNSGTYAVSFSGVSATQMTVTARRLDGASFTGTVTFSWWAAEDRSI